MSLEDFRLVWVLGKEVTTHVVRPKPLGLEPFGNEPFGNELKAEGLGAELAVQTEGVRKARLPYFDGKF